MRDHRGCVIKVEGVDVLLEFFLRHAHALVLPEVIDPGADDEGF